MGPFESNKVANAPCKSFCFYNAPSVQTVDQIRVSLSLAFLTLF